MAWEERKYFRLCWILFFLFVLFLFPRLIKSDNMTTLLITKQKREIVPSSYKYLVFPQGSNVQLIYCLTIGALSKPQGFFTLGVTAGLAYELPYKRTVPFRKPAEVYHRRSRRDLYRKLEVMLETQGKNGRICVLRELCKSGKRNREQPVKSSFLKEILHSVFTYPGEESDELPEQKLQSLEYEQAYNARDNCDELFPSSDCPNLIF